MEHIKGEGNHICSTEVCRVQSVRDMYLHYAQKFVGVLPTYCER
jgi:hypothetical protein